MKEIESALNAALEEIDYAMTSKKDQSVKEFYLENAKRFIKAAQIISSNQNERIEQLEQEVIKYRTEAANERELSEDIVGEREELYIRVEQLEKALEMAMPIVEHNSPTLAREINKALGKENSQ